MCGKIIPGLWSAAGLIWWLIAWRLVTADRRVIIPSQEAPPVLSLSIFKPLPPLGGDGMKNFARGLESFIAQLDQQSELLLGIHEADRAMTAPFIVGMQKRHPEARLKVVFRSEPDEVANPKIAWQKFLAVHAEGHLWLWSDADIIAPAGFLARARTEYEQAGESMLTFPYVVREMGSPCALLDTLFINAEFYPGILLLRKRGPVDFGLGSGMLFQREDFLNNIGWEELGRALADDFLLGQKMEPVRLSTATLETVPEAANWKDALLHDLRWAKTIRWNRPLGFAARIAVLPVMGWLLYLMAHPFSLFGWIGLFGMIQIDVLFAAILCRRIGCVLRGHDLLACELWSIWRPFLWLACWLPIAVTWRGQKWRSPKIT